MTAFSSRVESAIALRPVLLNAFRHAKAMLDEGAPVEIVIRLASKSRAQERHYHALLRDISQQYVHAGRKWDPDDTKRLMIDAFQHETRFDPINYPHLVEPWREMGEIYNVPAIGRDGFVTLGVQSRKFPKKLAAAFITWLQAFMSANGIHCTDPQWQDVQALAPRGGDA